MKRIVLGMLLLAVVACKKETPKKEQEQVKETLKTSEVASKKDTKDLKYTYKTPNGELLDIVFFTDSVKRVEILGFNQEVVLVLNQTTAWAKGAEYANDNYKLISKDKEIIFIKEKDTLQLKLVE